VSSVGSGSTIKTSSGTRNCYSVSGEAGSREASTVTRALVGAGSTGASLTFVSREALALTSGSVAGTLTSALDDVVGTVSIPLTEITTGGGVGDASPVVPLNRLSVGFRIGSSTSSNGLVGGDGDQGIGGSRGTLDGVESINDSDLGTSAEGSTNGCTNIVCHIRSGGEGEAVSIGRDKSWHSPLLVQTIRSGTREGVSLGASSLGAVSTSPGSILLSSGVLTDVVTASGTSIGVASTGVLSTTLTMARAEVGAVGRDRGYCSEEEHQGSFHSL